MAEDYLAQYRDEDSESSSMSDLELKDVVEKVGIPVSILEEAKAKVEVKPAPSIPFVGINIKKDEEVVPYTFNPEKLLPPPLNQEQNNTDDKKLEDLLKDPFEEIAARYKEKPQNQAQQYRASTPSLAPAPASNPNTKPKPVETKSYREKYQPVENPIPKAEPVNFPSYSNKQYSAPASYNPTAFLNYVPQTSFYEDPSVTRGTQDYKEYSKEFDREYGGNKAGQKELDAMVKRTEQRYKRLQELGRELETEDVDSLLFRNKLIRELSDIQNDLKEANSNVIVLMSDRSTMKDSYCLLQIKLKKTTSLNKTLQEDINMYIYLRIIKNIRREITFQNLQVEYNDIKDEVERNRVDIEKIKVTFHD